MSVSEFMQICEYFGIFMTSSIFLPFYACCIIVVGIYSVGKIIRGKMLW